MAKQVALDNLPEVRLLEDVTQESAQRLIEQLSAFKGKRVALSIFSDGGSAKGSNAVAKYIANPANDMHVEARVYGNAASGAMIIAAACEKAYIASGSFAMIHMAYAVGEDGKRTPDDQLSADDREALAAINADQVSLFSKRTGKTKAQVEKLLADGSDIVAEKAVEDGLFDGIIPQAARLAAFKSISMADEKKTRDIKVSASDALKAIASGVIPIPEDQFTISDAAKVTALDAQIAALTKERDDLKAAKEAAEAAKIAADTEKATEVAAKAKVEDDLKAAQQAVGQYQAALEKLKKDPLVAQVMPDGTTVVIPGSDPQQKQAAVISDRESHFMRTQKALDDYMKRKAAN